MLKTALYAVNFGEFYYENLDCFANYSKFGLKEIVLMHVIDPDEIQHGIYSAYDKKEEEKIQRNAGIKLEDIKNYLEKSGFKVSCVIKIGKVAEEIAEESKNDNIDFIVLDKKAGRHKGYLSFYGSPIYDILMNSEKPVLILKRVMLHASSGFRKDDKAACVKIFEDLVFATDFSSFSLKAIPFISALPPGTTKYFTILHVIESKTVKSAISEAGGIKEYEERLSGKFEDIIEKLGHAFTREKSNLGIAVRKGIPYEEISNFMDETEKKLLVLGFKGREKENFKEIMFGSTVTHVINSLPCSLFVIK